MAKIYWKFHGEGQGFVWWDCAAGRVQETTQGYDAYLTLPGQEEHLIGLCYSTSASAKAAVMRAYRKHAPLEVCR